MSYLTTDQNPLSNDSQKWHVLVRQKGGFPCRNITQDKINSATEVTVREATALVFDSLVISANNDVLFSRR